TLAGSCAATAASDTVVLMAASLRGTGPDRPRAHPVTTVTCCSPKGTSSRGTADTANKLATTRASPATATSLVVPLDTTTSVSPVAGSMAYTLRPTPNRRPPSTASVVTAGSPGASSLTGAGDAHTSPPELS